jgi:hypothetical protein
VTAGSFRPTVFFVEPEVDHQPDKQFQSHPLDGDRYQDVYSSSHSESQGGAVRLLQVADRRVTAIELRYRSEQGWVPYRRIQVIGNGISATDVIEAGRPAPDGRFTARIVPAHLSLVPPGLPRISNGPQGPARSVS